MSLSQGEIGPFLRGSQDHRKIQRAHALARYAERYGRNLSDFDYLALCARIVRHLNGHEGQRVKRVGRMSGMDGWETAFVLEIGPGRVIAAWDDQTQQIATFISPTERIIRSWHT